MNKIAIVGDLHITQSVSTRKDNYFETCMNKLNQVLENNDCVFILGDFFHTPVVNTEIVSEVFTLLKKHNKQVYTIIGNHDCISMNEKTIYKTSLGLLELVGVIKIIQVGNAIKVGDTLQFEAMPLNFKDIKKNNNPSFFLGHHFFNEPCSDSLTEEMLKDLYPNMVGMALGHQHCPNEIYSIGNSKIYRPGSLLRNANTEYNRNRKPFYYQATLEELSQGKPFRAVELNSLDGKELFVNNYIIKQREHYIANLEKTIALCSEKSNTKSKYSMLEALEELKTPRKCFDYISQTCKIMGVQLK